MNDNELLDMLSEYGAWTEEQTELQLTNPDPDSTSRQSTTRTPTGNDYDNDSTASVSSVDLARTKRRTRTGRFSGRSAFLASSAAAVLFIVGVGYALIGQRSTSPEQAEERDVAVTAATQESFSELACAASPEPATTTADPPVTPDHVYTIDQFVSETCTRTVFTLGAPTFGPANHIAADFETELVNHEGGFATIEMPQEWAIIHVGSFNDDPTLTDDPAVAPYESTSGPSLSDFGFAATLSLNVKQLSDQEPFVGADEPIPARQKGDINFSTPGTDSELYVNHGASKYSIAVLSDPARIVVDSPIPPGDTATESARGATGPGVHISKITASENQVIVDGVGAFGEGTGVFEIQDSSGDQVEASWRETLPNTTDSVGPRFSIAAGMWKSNWQRFRLEIEGLSPGTYTFVEIGGRTDGANVEVPFEISE